MRRAVPLLLLLTLTACAAAPGPAEQAENAAGVGPGLGGGEFTRIGPHSLEKWASFPVDAAPRPLVLLGETVNVEKGFAEGDGKAAFLDGRVDADGKVPPEAAEAFAQLVKPNAGEPKLKVLSAAKGTAMFGTDRGARELPAWIFELTQTLGPVAVLSVKPEYTAKFGTAHATVSADGMTLTVAMAKATEPCPGDPRITLVPEWLESATAVAVGLKQEVGPVAPGERGNCAHDAAYRTADYTVRLDKPLGNRVMVDAGGNPVAVISS